MKVYVLRHGETDGNKADISIGNLDIPLNEMGKLQALQRRSDLSRLDIDFAFCSPKQRTLETLQLAAPHLLVCLDDRLLSRDHGEFQGVKNEGRDLSEYWNIRVNHQYEKAESVKHVYDRVCSFLDEIRVKYPDKNILIVTHSAIVRCIYYYFNGLPEDGNLFGYQSHTASLETYEI